MTDHHDDPVDVSGGELRLTVETMNALKKATGLQLSEILGGEDEATRFQAMAFAELSRRHAGHLPDPGELWERAGRVELNFVPPRRLDPTSGESSTTSPPFAGTGE
jgi:hypothetical protein